MGWHETGRRRPRPRPRPPLTLRCADCGLEARLDAAESDEARLWAIFGQAVPGVCRVPRLVREGGRITPGPAWLCPECARESRGRLAWPT